MKLYLIHYSTAIKLGEEIERVKVETKYAEKMTKHKNVEGLIERTRAHDDCERRARGHDE